MWGSNIEVIRVGISKLSSIKIIRFRLSENWDEKPMTLKFLFSYVTEWLYNDVNVFIPKG